MNLKLENSYANKLNRPKCNSKKDK